ncbi:MAG: N-acetyltransferase [Armatimonadetes bacterium]|nr:N-acetyltransferase [Armatimonadota bacterium]
MIPSVNGARSGVAAPLAGAHLRPARVSDAPAIQRLIATFADRDEMLHRPLGELYENIRDFFVVEEADGAISACGALHVCWAHLAEIKSLAVAEGRQGQGLGRRIVEACLQEAETLGLQTVFALTYRPEFFTRIGFRVVDKATLPHKVWNECVRCPKFYGCGEIAVVRELSRAPATPLRVPILG